MVDIHKEQKLHILQLCEILTRLLEKNPDIVGEKLLDIVDIAYLKYLPQTPYQWAIFYSSHQWPAELLTRLLQHYIYYLLFKKNDGHT